MEHTYRRGELLRHLSFRAKIDAIAFRAPKEPLISKTRFFGPVYGAFGLQDPVRYQLEDAALRDCPIARLEVAVDIGPSRATMPKVAPDAGLWSVFMRQTFLLMSENLFPWGGPGIGSGPARAFDGATRKTSFLDRNRPTPTSTVYFGHDGQPAMLSLYHKVTDQGQRLPRLRERVRVELVLSEDGCRLLGLNRVGDLLEFSYRTTLAPYFRAIRPRVRSRLFASAAPPMRKLLLDRVGRQWTDAVHERYWAGGGSHSLFAVTAADTSKNASYEALNREMRRALSNILRTRP